MAHFLDRNLERQSPDKSPKRVLELGCGTAIAAMVCFRLGYRVAVQDRVSVLHHTAACLRMNDVSAQIIEGQWGNDFDKRLHCENQICSFDIVIMADVLYHVEDFDNLISTINVCTIQGGKIYICFEQRRKDLSSFFEKLDLYFERRRCNKYVVTSVVTSRQTSIFIMEYEKAIVGVS